MENFRFTRICREIVDVAIYALYPESFCGVNLAIRKVFAFSDSAAASSQASLSSAECVRSATPENPFENVPQGQNAPSKSPLPSSRSNATSKAENKETTGKSGAKSDFKPRVTLAKGADPRLRKGPNDSLLL